MTEENTYYAKQINLAEFGQVKQSKLAKSKVLVVGAGGLGSPCLQYLAGAGIGHIVIVDGDKVALSNLHRQTLFTLGDIDQEKATVAKKRLQQINPFIEVESIPEFLTLENASTLIKNVDLVIDCTDNLNIRYLINDFCVLFDKPMLMAAVYKFEGQVSVFNYKNGPTYRCFNPSSEKNELASDCNSAGIVNVIPGILGLIQANEAIKVLAELDGIICDRVLFINTLNLSIQHFFLHRKDIDYKSELVEKGVQLLNRNCASENRQNLAQIFSEINQQKALIVDVRQVNELPLLQHSSLINIPLAELETKLAKLNTKEKIYFLCKSGVRSDKALTFAKKHFPESQFAQIDHGITDEFINLWKKQVKIAL